MGEVYLAHDTQLERKVALKVLPADLSEDPERLQRLRREARALAALDHPHIVPVYSFESANGVQFLTMAYIEGQPLEELIPEDGFSAERLLDFAVALADALRAAHEQGIVHRDLKPANVMVDHEGRLRVLDFGLSKKDEPATADFSEMTTRGMTEQVTRAGTILGTYPYMSPEQAEGKSVDARSDLFSLGVMLYEMACGHRPFAGETGISLITSILRDHQRPVTGEKPDLPPRLDEILDRCLEKDTEKRYSTAETLRNDLEELRRGLVAGTAVVSRSEAPTVIAPPDPSEETGIRLTRRQAIWLGVVLLAGAITTVALWAPWPSGRAERSLAILPFENPLQDQETEYLCDGLAESLIRQVSRLPSVRVTPLNAVLNLKGETLDADEVGRRLDVETLLTGTLARNDGRLSITARLQDATSGEDLWNRAYDRDAAELLGIQDEIASAILEDGLRMELSSDDELEVARPPTTSGEAYDLYLQARYLQRRATEPDYLQALELLQRATVRDPGFAQAYLMQAGIHSAMVIDGYERPTDGWAKANRFLRQALALDPNLPDAAAVRHGLAFFFDWDWDGAEQERLQALQSPVGEFDPDLLRTYSFELIALGRPDEALELARRSRELDPLSIGLAMLEADYLARTGQLDTAIALYERTIEMEPDNPEQYFGLAEALVLQGRFDEAIEARRQAHAIAGDEELAEMFATAKGKEGYLLADSAWVQVQLVWLKARSTWAYASPLDFARAYAQLGETELAFESLEQAFIDRAPGLVFLNSDRAWNNIRDDPRFLEAVRRVGLPETI